MKLKKIIAAMMVGALSVATVPLIAPTPVDHRTGRGRQGRRAHRTEGDAQGRTEGI